jgi:hypothetical protein
LLLDVGVDGAAYDDRLLTPLDHLARRACMSMAYPLRVVNTIRALVERGRCQPLLSLTSNAVASYRGPEEGFALLFTSEYAGANLEEPDSEEWTSLGDATLNFGWWTELCIDDPAVSWKCLYLLRAGANPHSFSSRGRLTPLDAYLRGCTSHQVEHAGKWLRILSQSGFDLHKYAIEEQNLHQPEHFLETSWDAELWRWIPTKRRVVYHFGQAPDQLSIWLEDYDALSWFGIGRFDLEIFLVCTQSESQARWKRINDDDNRVVFIEPESSPSLITSLLCAGWFQFLLWSLVLNYTFHVFLVDNRRL